MQIFCQESTYDSIETHTFIQFVKIVEGSEGQAMTASIFWSKVFEKYEGKIT